MIYLTNGLNRVYVTASDRSLLTSPYYTLRLRSSENNSFEKILRLTKIDLDLRNDTFEFTLVDLANEDLNAGDVNLIRGDYYYYIYESATDDLIIANKRELERGAMNYNIDETVIVYNVPVNEITYNG